MLFANTAREHGWSVHTTRVHGPWTRASFWTPVNTARANTCDTLVTNMTREHVRHFWRPCSRSWTRVSKMTPLFTGREHGRQWTRVVCTELKWRKGKDSASAPYVAAGGLVYRYRNVKIKVSLLLLKPQVSLTQTVIGEGTLSIWRFFSISVAQTLCYFCKLT